MNQSPQRFPTTFRLRKGRSFESVAPFHFYVKDAYFSNRLKFDDGETVLVKMEYENQEIILCTLSKENPQARLNHLIKKGKKVKFFTTNDNSQIVVRGLKLFEEDLNHIDDLKEDSKLKELLKKRYDKNHFERIRKERREELKQCNSPESDGSFESDNTDTALYLLLPFAPFLDLSCSESDLDKISSDSSDESEDDESEVDDLETKKDKRNGALNWLCFKKVLGLKGCL